MGKITDNKIRELLRSLADDASLKPETHFRTHAGIRLTNLVAPAPLPVQPAGFWHHAVVKLAAAAAPLAFAGTVLAAQTSLPGQPLYPVKIASEKVALTLAPKALKTRVAAEIIDRRADEIKNLLESESSLIGKEIHAYETTVNDLQKLPGVEQKVVTEHVESHADLIKGAEGQHAPTNVEGDENKNEPQPLPESVPSVKPTLTEPEGQPINLREITPTAVIPTILPNPEVKGDKSDRLPEHLLK